MHEQPAIGSYGLISDCHAAALVSGGSIDWCCLPRFDSGSHFGRLLDWDSGGFCSIQPAGDGDFTSQQEYLEDTLVLVTRFHTDSGTARLVDCFAIEDADDDWSHRWILRTIVGERGECELAVRIAPRFDYGDVSPWLRQHGARVYSATGGDDALLVTGDLELELRGLDELHATCKVRPGDRVRICLRSLRAEEIDRLQPESEDPEGVDRALDGTIEWWQDWAAKARFEGAHAAAAKRSALVLKGLTYRPTGAIAASVSTSLPETPGGERNWDYRYSWIRDSVFSVRSLAELGFEDEADAFRRFVARSAAGHAGDLQTACGVGGERRLTEETLPELSGYRGAQPVRIGNAAASQLQLDAYGEIVNMTWRWHDRGHSPDDDDWRFLTDLVEAAIENWQQPDHGIWEWRPEPLHFVHSKVMCWIAIDRGLRLAEECMRRAPARRWSQAREELRAAIDEQGVDRQRGVFVQAFGGTDLDAALLLLPSVGYCEWDDERMLSTADAIEAELCDGGLVRRYANDDGIEGEEGTFVACSFWLAECLIRQGKLERGRDLFHRAENAANDLGLFPEQADRTTGELLGNFPLAISHYSHIAAALALDQHAAEEPAGGREAKVG
jgi:GH15 family glucan-1,4-alpha-glucosidase